MNPAAKLLSSLLASHSCTTKAMCSILIIFLLVQPLGAQDTTFQLLKREQTIITDTFPTPPLLNLRTAQLSKKQIDKRVKLVTAANIGFYGATMFALYH